VQDWNGFQPVSQRGPAIFIPLAIFRFRLIRCTQALFRSSWDVARGCGQNAEALLARLSRSGRLPSGCLLRNALEKTADALCDVRVVSGDRRLALLRCLLDGMPKEAYFNVPTLPWRVFGSTVSDRQYVALLSFLPLKHSSRIPWFLLNTARIMNQLSKTRGLVGYSLRAQFLAKRFWTLSVWEDQSALTGFVHAQPHAQTMDVMMPQMGETKFVTWSVKGSEIPLSWDDALKRWAEN